MNLKGIPESKHFEDTSAEPWYSPNKLMASIEIGLKRAIRDPKQLKIDQNAEIIRQNPLPPSTPQQRADNMKASVKPTKGGWLTRNPGSIVDEFIPGYVDTPQNKGESDLGLKPEEQAVIDHLLRRHRQ